MAGPSVFDAVLCGVILAVCVAALLTLAEIVAKSIR